MKTIFILSIFVLSFINVNAQAPAIEWQQHFGGTNADKAYSIIQTQDEGYIVAGASESNDGDVGGNQGETDYWILKINTFGDTVWQKSLGGSYSDEASSVIQTQNSEYIVIGSSYSSDGDVSGHHGNNYNRDLWVVKLDTLGDVIWEKSLGGSSDDVAHSIIQTQDGGYIVSGSSYSNDGDVTGNHGEVDYWIVKLDTLGSILWQKCLGGSLSEFASCIIQTQDGGYIVSGHSYSNDGDVTGNYGNCDYWIAKLDHLGNIIWGKSLGGSNDDKAYSVIQNIDKTYMIAGYSESNNGNVSGNQGYADVWIVKLDTLGNTLWQKCLGGSAWEVGASIISNLSGYIVSGYAGGNDGDVSGNHGFGDYWILQLDSIGNILWQKCLGGSNDEEVNSIIKSQDGGYIIVGHSMSSDGDVGGNYGHWDYWIVKFAGDSSVITGENKNIVGITSLTLYPNPASEILTLELEGKTQENYQIFDLQGKMLLQGVLNQGKNLVNIAGLAKGSYVIRTESTGMVTKRSRSMPFEVVE